MLRLEALRRRARRLRTEAHALYLAARDPRTPWAARLLAGAVVAYALSPIDLIPDFIPVVGYLDDLILVPMGITLAIRLIPPPVLAECREQAYAAEALPRSRFAAAVIIGVWLAAAALAAFWFADLIAPTGDPIGLPLDPDLGEALVVGVAVVVAALAASTLAAVAGFGGAVIMLPVLVWAFGVRDAIPILTVAQLIGNLSRVGLNRYELDWAVVRRFALGAVPAAVVGGVVFATAPAAALVRVLGLFLLLMVVYRHTSWGKRSTMSLGRFLPLGAAAGLLSAILGTVGPFAAPFFLAYGLVKGAYIGTEAMTAVVMHITKLAVYGGYALLDPRGVLTGLAIGAVMLVGSYAGKRILSRVPERVFPYLIEAVLLVAGILFIVRG